MADNALNPKLEDGLFAASYNAFDAILPRDANDPTVFAKRMERLKIHRLLSYRLGSRFKPKEIVVETNRLDDSRYRRKLIRELKAPRPSKWEYRDIDIDRDKILADESYRCDMAKLLAYKWTLNLLPVEEPVTALLLLKQDADSLTYCLDFMGPHQISAETVGTHRLRSICEEILDKNETLNAGLKAIREAGAEARRIFTAEMSEFNKRTLAEFNARVEETLAESKKVGDDIMSKTRDNLASTAEHSRQVLAESRSRDPETEWREQLRKAEEKRKLENGKMGWKGKSLLVLGIAGVATALGYFLEINGVTPFAALSGLIN